MFRRRPEFSLASPVARRPAASCREQPGAHPRLASRRFPREVGPRALGAGGPHPWPRPWLPGALPRRFLHFRTRLDGKGPLHRKKSPGPWGDCPFSGQGISAPRLGPDLGPAPEGTGECPAKKKPRPQQVKNARMERVSNKLWGRSRPWKIRFREVKRLPSSLLPGAPGFKRRAGPPAPAPPAPGGGKMGRCSLAVPSWGSGRCSRTSIKKEKRRKPALRGGRITP